MKAIIFLVFTFASGMASGSQLCSIFFKFSHRVNRSSWDVRKNKIVATLQNIEDPAVLEIKARKEEDSVPAYRAPWVSPIRYELSKREILLMEMAIINPDFILPTHFSATQIAPLEYITVRNFILARNTLDYLESLPEQKRGSPNQIRKDYRRNLDSIEKAIKITNWIEGYWFIFIRHRVHSFYSSDGVITTEDWVRDVTISQFIKGMWNEIQFRLEDLKANKSLAESAVYSGEIDRLLSATTYAARSLSGSNAYRDGFRAEIFKGLDKVLKLKPPSEEHDDED